MGHFGRSGHVGIQAPRLGAHTTGTQTLALGLPQLRGLGQAEQLL